MRRASLPPDCAPRPGGFLKLYLFIRAILDYFKTPKNTIQILNSVLSHEIMVIKEDKKCFRKGQRM